ncbi:hypothetical protein K933_15747 [Candidatus Halobonum tyrrellensis G22]|uniref:Carbohydrate-binding domain-containing protein n=1 Tax=Candidatus Halobonum tyrrellensis G22 TaxID=1324957 RepID=V4IUV7_9EURY|nr:hypothetical protein K933_15747 [Candidatus Halobonum tyrrellensis G22]
MSVATYEVRHAEGPIPLSGDAADDAWLRANAAHLDQFSWGESGPDTAVRALHDGEALYLQFLADDDRIHADVTELNGPTFEDSSVEFFATPGPAGGTRYLNFEANCCGTFKLGWQEPRWRERGVGRDLVPPGLADEITVETSEPGPTRDPRPDDDGWWLAARIPESTLRSLTGREVTVGSGAVWRGNFYRSGVPDERKATWSPLPLSTPEYHSPEFFGWVEFE